MITDWDCFVGVAKYICLQSLTCLRNTLNWFLWLFSLWRWTNSLHCKESLFKSVRRWREYKLYLGDEVDNQHIKYNLSLRVYSTRMVTLALPSSFRNKKNQEQERLRKTQHHILIITYEKTYLPEKWSRVAESVLKKDNISR